MALLGRGGDAGTDEPDAWGVFSVNVAAEVLGVNQPKISALKHHKLEGFSVERLMHFATALEHDVVIEIRPRAKVEKKGGF